MAIFYEMIKGAAPSKDKSYACYNYIVWTNEEKTAPSVYSNVKGAPYTEDDDIKLILKNHIRSSVYFEKSIRDMIDKGVETFVEVGPGKALRGFVKKIDRSLKLLNVEDMASLNATIETLK